MSEKKYICCICDKEFEGFGNDPFPVSEDPNDRCCDECNIKIVLPRRIGLIKEEIENN